MKSVYVGRRPCECIAVAFDIVGLDAKTLGALLKLGAESGLIFDRIDRTEVIFFDVCPHQQAKKAEDKKQLEIDFSKPAAGDSGGPSEMPEGFTCTYSGECPTPSKACATCEYASNGIPKDAAAAPDLEPQTGEEPAVDNGLAEEMKSSVFLQWATMSPEERQAAGIEAPEAMIENNANLAGGEEFQDEEEALEPVEQEVD